MSDKEEQVAPSARGAETSSSVRKRWAGLAVRSGPYLLSLVLTLLFYHQWFLPGHAFVLADCQEFNAPVRAYATKALLAGRLPEWSHSLFGGYPFLSDPQSAVFHPTNLVLPLFSSRPATSEVMDRLVFLQVVLIGLGSVFLARGFGFGCLGSVAASLVISHTGFVVSHLCHLPVICALAAGLWMLGALVRAVRDLDVRWSLVAGLCLACSIFAGHAQTTLFVCYGAAAGGGLLAACHARRARSWRRLGTGLTQCVLAFVVGGFAALVQVLPTMVLLANSSRSILYPDQAMLFSFPPRAFPGLWFPALYHPMPWRLGDGLGYAAHTMAWLPTGHWEYLLHLGVASTAAVLVGWLANLRSWLFHVLFWGAIFIVAASLGQAGGIYPLLFEYAPGFGQVRIPPRLMCLAFVAWGILAGAGVDVVARRGRAALVRRSCAAALGVIAVATAAGFVVLVVAKSRMGSWSEAFRSLFVLTDRTAVWASLNLTQFTGHVSWQVVFGGCLVAAICALLLMACLGFRRVASLGLVILVAAELGIYAYSRNVRRWPGFDDPVGSMMTALPEPPKGRISTVVETEGPYLDNSALCRDIEFLRGYNPLHLSWYDTFMPRSALAAGQIAQETLLDRWNVTDIIFRHSARHVSVPGRTLELGNAGWVLAGRGHRNLREFLAWEVSSSKPVRAVHLASAVGRVDSIARGTPIASVTLEMSPEAPGRSAPVRLGIETGDGKMTVSAPAYRCADNFAWTGVPYDLLDAGQFYVSTFDAGSTCALRRVSLTMSGSHSAVIAVSWLVVEYADGTVDRRPGLEAVGYRLLASRSSEWTVLRRPDPPGYAQLIPRAVPVALAAEAGARVAQLRDVALGYPTAIMLDVNQISKDEALVLNSPLPGKTIGTTTFVRDRPEKYHVDTHTTQPAWLLLSQTRYPGWKATLDGTPVRLLHADGAQFAVALPLGNHRLTMEFHTPLLRLGAVCSAGTWLLCAAVLARRRRIALPFT